MGQLHYCITLQVSTLQVSTAIENNYTTSKQEISYTDSF